MSDLYRKSALNIAHLVSEKQQAYGDSFSQAAGVIRILFPDGIPVDKYQDALAVIRVIDKLFRIANKKDAFGEDPWQDIAGYALLSLCKRGE